MDFDRLYHGTTQAFEAFSVAPSERNTPSCTHLLGVFLSSCPRIAGHFTLKTEVIDAGYDSHVGSQSLRRDPWQFDADPFLEGAAVLSCQVALANPVLVDPVQWMAIVEELDPEAVAALRQRWRDAGHDGVVIEAWDGESEHPDHGVPCVEMHAQTVIVFDPQRINIVARAPAQQAWIPGRSRLSP